MDVLAMSFPSSRMDQSVRAAIARPRDVIPQPLHHRLPATLSSRSHCITAYPRARHPAAIALTVRQGASFKGSQVTAGVRKPLKETCFMVGRLPRCRGGSTRAVETSPQWSMHVSAYLRSLERCSLPSTLCSGCGMTGRTLRGHPKTPAPRRL